MDNTSSLSDKALGLFSAYIKSHCDYLVENLAAAAGDTVAHAGYVSLFNVPSLASRPFYHSLKFSFSWLGKKMVCAENESRKFNFTEIENDFVLVEYFQPVQLATQKIPSDIIYQLSDGCKNFMLTVKPIDVLQLVGGTMGASAGTLTFALFIGPPGLIGIPVLLLTEVIAQGFGEYIAKMSAKTLLGDQANVPLCKQALQSGLLTHHPEFKPSQAILYHYETPQISITTNITDGIQETSFQKPKS